MKDSSMYPLKTRTLILVIISLFSSAIFPILADTHHERRNESPLDASLAAEVPDIIFCLRTIAEDPHWYANISHYIYDTEEKLYSLGGSALCIYRSKSGKTDILMEDSEGGFRDPIVSYDAQKVLFSYRKGGQDYYHLYEMNLDGSGLKQITFGNYDDIEPCYLPDGRIMFASTRCKRWVNCWVSRVATLYRCNADGSHITQISANIEQDNTPTVLENGQILYTRWEYVDRSQVDFHHLWTMNPDGSRQTILFGNQNAAVRERCVLIDAEPIPGTNKILSASSFGHGIWEHGAALVIVDPSKGPDKKESLHYIYEDGGIFYDPFPINDKKFIVSRGQSLVLGTYDEKAFITLCEVPEQFQPKSTSEKKKQIFEPCPIYPRKKSPIIPSLVNDLENNGEIVLFNAYEGRNMEGVAPGEIKYLLVLETLPMPAHFSGGQESISYAGTFTLNRIIGLTPVESDGSARMKLPKNRAFFFVLLDENFSAIQRMQSFTSVMGGELISCIGCHENRNDTPTYTPTTTTPLALKKPAQFPTPLTDIPEIIDFPKHIQPILDRNCIQCHNGDTPSGGRNLTGDLGPIYTLGYFSLVGALQVSDAANSWDNLEGPRVLGDARSDVMKKILSGHHQINLTPQEIKLMRFWINTGATYAGTYGALGNGQLGATYCLQGAPRQGSAWNTRVHTIASEPRVKKAADTIRSSCTECHKELMPVISEEGFLGWDNSRAGLQRGEFTREKYLRELKFSRHAIYNLTHPEQSIILKAPLSKAAGGLELCKNPDGSPIISSTDDPRYQDILAAVNASKEELEKMGRFSEKNYIPNPAYTREMIFNGILPKDHPSNKPYDVYDTDRRYWKSLW